MASQKYKIILALLLIGLSGCSNSGGKGNGSFLGLDLLSQIPDNGGGGAPPFQVTTLGTLTPIGNQWGPGSVYTIPFHFSYTGNISDLIPAFRMLNSNAAQEITNTFGLPNYYQQTPFSSSIASSGFSGQIIWQSDPTILPGQYEIGFMTGTTNFFYPVTQVTVANSNWMHIFGDGDPHNIKIAFVGDNWSSQHLFQRAVIETAHDFITGDPVVSNYSPSINLVARRSIGGLDCRKCRGNLGTWDPSCGVNPSDLTSAAVATALAAAIINPFLFPAAVLAAIGANSAVQLSNKQNDMFSCPIDNARGALSPVPNGYDYAVVYANGGDSPNQWWRSHDGTTGGSVTEAILAELGLGPIPDHDLIFLSGDMHKNEGDTYVGDGDTLIHEFGHAFASLPDFYDWDPDCIQYKSRMCDQSLKFASPEPHRWASGQPDYNRSWDKVAMIDEFNRRVGGISSITTGNSFPNPSQDSMCTGKKFQVAYRTGAKQLSYVTAKIVDGSSRLLYEYASEKPVPNTPGLEIKFGFYPNETSWSPGDIGYGFPNVTKDFDPLPQEIYFFDVQAGDVHSDSGNGNKFSFLGNALPAIQDVVCSPRDSEPPSAPLLDYANGLPNYLDGQPQVNIGFYGSIDNVAVKEYILYRNNYTSGNSDVVVATIPNSIFDWNWYSFEDHDVQWDTPTQYYVVARDTSGNISAKSNILTATVEDFVPPTPPTSVDVLESDILAVVVKWGGATDNNRVAYHTFELYSLNVATPFYGTYTDYTPSGPLRMEGPFKPGDYILTVQAVDPHGNYSDPLQTQITISDTSGGSGSGSGNCSGRFCPPKDNGF